MGKFIETLARKYLNRKQKVAQEANKRIDDKKLEEAGDKLKALYEFVRFINEKCVRNRHERKTFWRNVSEGRPLVEETIINVLRKMGVKDESIKAVTDAKIDAMKQREAQEMARKNQIEEAKKKMAKDSAIGCPTDCSADCSKCANKPQDSEIKKIEEEKKN
jgi:hypothetical protein